MQRGVSIWEAAAFLGMSPEVLQEVYGHHHPDYLQSAAAAIAQRDRFVSVVESVVDSGQANDQKKKSMNHGRSGRIRTCDPCFPKAVLYRAEPHSD